MISQQDLADHLQQLLDTTAFDDYCVNGLQIDGKPEIGKIVTGVSVSERLIRKAITLKADAVIVHHGMFWRSTPHPLALTGYLFNRVKLLMDNNISLFGYHLPLDSHPELGNNACIARMLGLENVVFVPAGKMRNPIAAIGDLGHQMTAHDFAVHADTVLQDSGKLLSREGMAVNRVFVLAGGGGGYYLDAGLYNAEIMVTGELPEESVRAAEEIGVAQYALGHYNSEKWGIIALGDYLRKKFDLELTFIDIPNPV